MITEKILHKNPRKSVEMFNREYVQQLLHIKFVSKLQTDHTSQQGISTEVYQ